MIETIQSIQAAEEFDRYIYWIKQAANNFTHNLADKLHQISSEEDSKKIYEVLKLQATVNSKLIGFVWKAWKTQMISENNKMTEWTKASNQTKNIQADGSNNNNEEITKCLPDLIARLKEFSDIVPQLKECLVPSQTKQESICEDKDKTGVILDISSIDNDQETIEIKSLVSSLQCKDHEGNYSY